MKSNINQATFDRYLEASGLAQDVKEALRKEFKSSDKPQDVYTKAVSLSGRRVMTKVPSIKHK